METTIMLCDSDHCRLCAEENKHGTYLFSSEENSEDISFLINRYLPIRIENDKKFPTSICPGCHIQLEATKCFMDLIVKGQSKLRELYQAQKDLLQRQEKQRHKLEEILHTVNPNSSVETYTIQSDETGEKFLIQIFSEGPLFPSGHELALQAEGLDRPRKKRGRPPKPTVEKNIETEQNEEVENQREENILQNKDEDVDADGRKRRKIRAPARYQGVVQGKELDKIFKEEGVIDEEEIDDSDLKTINSNENDNVIGRIETDQGEDLNEPVFLKKARLKSKTETFNKKRVKKKYQCEICLREFMHFGRYVLHKKSHKIEYVCEQTDCTFKTTDNADLENHKTETGHASILAVEKDEKAGGVLRLPAEKLDEIKQHKNENDNSTDLKYRCELCDKAFTCKQNLAVHERVIHNKETPFLCSICDRSFSYANSLKLHMLKHERRGELTSSQPVKLSKYSCDICGRVLHHPSSLVYHRETEHSNGRRFVCNKCNKSFKHRQLLQRHQLVHTEERPFRCGRCSATFKTQANLSNHEAVHLGEKRYVCSRCGQRFGHRTSLTLHLRWHEGLKPYVCDVCHKAFSQKGNLAEHSRIHTGEKPYCCDHCGRSFTTSSQFTLHRKRHTGEKPWVCEYCSKSFLHKDTFKTHVRRHLNDRPFKCKHCPSAFTEAWALKRHERIHSGEKPYVCGKCGRTFADSSNKSKHMRTHNVPAKNVAYADNMVKPILEEVQDLNSETLLNVTMEEPTMKRPLDSGFQLTQLIDQQGNPISITTQDGQTVPVVTGTSDESSIQGLLPDGTLIPIEITTVQEKDVEDRDEKDITINSGPLPNSEIPSTMDFIKNEDEEILKTDDSDENQKIDPNIQFFININQDLGLDTFFIESIKK